MKHITILLLTAIVFIGCKRKFDTPPIKTIPEGSIITIADLRAMYVNQAVSITDTLTIFANATTDETSGNFYKEVYVQDPTGAIVLRLDASGGIYEGDSLRISLVGTELDNYNGMLQLSNIDADNNIVKQATGKFIIPESRPLVTITSVDQGKLIKITDVEFSALSLGSTWADGVNQQSVNNYLTDCNGNEVILRTSGYANFADQTIPELHGDITCIVGVYNADLQVYVRNPQDAEFTEPRCTSGGGSGSCDPLNSLSESFSSQTTGNLIDQNCWTSVSTIGSKNWITAEVSSDKCAEGTSFGSFDSSNEMWMVSPEMNYNSSNILNFQSAVNNWTHDGLSIWIATDYDGSNPALATWTEITSNFTIAGSGSTNNAYVNSGDYNISSVLGSFTGTYNIGFKYNGSFSGGQSSTFKIDNVNITQ